MGRKTLEKTVRHMKENRNDGLVLRPLNLSSALLVLITYASLENARWRKSQLGYIEIMVDDSGTGNIIHYASKRCQRVTQSLIKSECRAQVMGFDLAYVIRHLTEELLNKKVASDAYVDSRPVFDVISKDGLTNESRLQLYIHALRQSSERR